MDTKELKGKKLVFVITDFGAFNIFLSELCNHLLLNYNYQIFLICSKEKVIKTLDKFDFGSKITIHYVDIPRTPNFYNLIKSAISIRKVINTVNPDLIHAHFTTGIFPTILFLKNRFRILGTFHGLGFVQSVGSRKFLFYVIELICFIRLNKIILLNKKDYQSVPFFLKSKAVLSQSLGLGCDLSVFSSDNFSVKNIKTELGIQNEFVISFTGRFVHFKGFHLVVRIFFLLEQEFGKKFKLLLMGGFDSSHRSGLTQTEYESLLINKGIINLGFVSDVERYLAISDLFVFLSKREGVPISITEALAMGVPVVTLNSRGCSDLVEDKVNGFLISEELSDLEIINNCFNLIRRIYLEQNSLMPIKKNILANRNRLSRINFIEENAIIYKSEFKN
jgi:glycosyltransferase involved in cell wall biosynthesis